MAVIGFIAVDGTTFFPNIAIKKNPTIVLVLETLYWSRKIEKVISYGKLK